MLHHVRDLKLALALVDQWELSPVEPMEPIMHLNFMDWNADLPGVYRIVRDPDLRLTLAVGEGGNVYSRIYGCSYYKYFRQYWVQRLTIEPDRHPEAFHFRRLVEQTGAWRFRPRYGDHGQLPMEWAEFYDGGDWTTQGGF